MHILHLEAGRYLYGGALQVLYLMRGLAADGHRSTLVCPRGSEIAAAWRAAATLPLPMAGDLDPRPLWRLVRLLRRIRPQIVHVHSRRGADLWGGLAARLSGTPAVITRRVDNPEATLPARLKYRLYRRAIAISPAIAAELRRLGVAGDKLSLVPSAVDTERFAPGGDRDWLEREFGFEPRDRVVGMVAQFIPRKGHHDLLRAIPAILAGEPRARFLLLGRGPLQPEIAAHCRRAGLEGVVRLAGFRNDPERILPALDLLLHPARLEGLGVALLQAAAAAVAVVAYRAGGIPLAVEDGVSGLLTAPGDVDALARSALALLGDPERARALGAAGRRRVCARFSIAAMAAGNLAVYRGITDRGAGLPLRHSARSNPAAMNSG